MGSVVNSERMPSVRTVPIGTQAATITLPVGYFRKRTRLKEARLNDLVGIAASNANYVTVTLQDVGPTPKVYASYDSRAANQGALTAYLAKLMTLGGGVVLGSVAGATATPVLGDTTNPEVDIPAGSNLQLLITVTGAVTFTTALLQMENYPL